MKARILVLDDEPAIARSVKRVLVSAGFDVEAVSDVGSARAKLREARFSVIVSDERMPEMSGVAFLEECAREYPAATRIMLTGYADAQTAAEAVNRAEIFRLLFKPWSEDEFVSAVREAAWRSSLVDGDDAPLDGPTAEAMLPRGDTDA